MQYYFIHVLSIQISHAGAFETPERNLVKTPFYQEVNNKPSPPLGSLNALIDYHSLSGGPVILLSAKWTCMNIEFNLRLRHARIGQRAHSVSS